MYIFYFRSEGGLGFLKITSRSERCFLCRMQRRRTIDRDNFRRKQTKLKATQKKVDKVRTLKGKLKRIKAKVCKLVFVILHNIFYHKANNFLLAL